MQFAGKQGREAEAASSENANQEHRSAHGDSSGARRGSSLSYTSRVTISFVLISVMTALVAFGVLSYVWEQHFQSYTRENMQSIADTTASNIASRYASDGNQWYGSALSAASVVHELNSSVGVQVMDKNGNIIYDDSRTMDSDLELSLAPANVEARASSSIISKDGEVLGMVNVWVYGSNTLLTQADQDFREKSYRAMIFSTALAVVIALFVGLLFARSLVDPINRISRAAKEIGSGDLSARTGLEGVDEISQLGMTFDNMAEAVEKDRQLERRLTTDVAHELRTPLMAIQATVEAILDGVFEANEERLETINSEVQRLSRLVDAILKLSRLENRALPMKEEVVDVGSLVNSLVLSHEAFVTDSGLYLNYDAEPDVYVYGDRDFIRQAVANLISNAVRYTPEGGISVSVSKGETMAAIAVADTGIGLTDEECKMVFSRFWRADSGRTRESGGLGVGLSVVKEIVDQHGGWVRAEGVPNEGCTFTIYIPLYNEEQEKQQRLKLRKRFGGEDNAALSRSAQSGGYSRWATGHESRRPSEEQGQGGWD